MLRKYSNSRSLGDNIKLGAMTAFSAGMVNVASLILFFSFTSNVTGHYAILAEEIAKGNWFQVLVVFSWIFCFFAGSFFSNYMIIHGERRSSYITHSIPLILEMICILTVGFYGHFIYSETLMETEIMVAVLLLAMGLQNGLTASISNFSVKTTHLTGLTTDLAAHLSMLTKKKYRQNKQVRDKVKLLSFIAAAYLTGGVIAGSITYWFEFTVFFVIAITIVVVLIYDISKIYLTKAIRKKKVRISVSLVPQSGNNSN
ncbi:YoaK family protein [Wandonia haliotis]|uniref:YoaK family protein n=1 Tax=Wandonia haliotis TaxID=574963 RepID=A0ABN1MLW0_9FLAO